MKRQLALGLAAGRVLLGAGIWLAHKPAMKALGFDGSTGEARALARLAGTRDLAMGALALSSGDDPERLRAATRANALVDAGDALAFGIALVRRDGIDGAALRGVAAASAATVAGLWLAAEVE